MEDTKVIEFRAMSKAADLIKVQMDNAYSDWNKAMVVGDTAAMYEAQKRFNTIHQVWETVMEAAKELITIKENQ